MAIKNHLHCSVNFGSQLSDSFSIWKSVLGPLGLFDECRLATPESNICVDQSLGAAFLQVTHLAMPNFEIPRDV